MPGTVSVGCKLPHGLHLQVFTPGKAASNGVPEQPAKPIGKRVTIKGANANFSDTILTIPAGSFGITENVDKDFMERWLKDNRDMEAVKNGQIFIHDKTVTVAAEGKAKREQVTGFEGLNPAKPPLGIKPVTKDDKDD